MVAANFSFEVKAGNSGWVATMSGQCPVSVEDLGELHNWV